jgi:glycolate oxidase FAD binding subunit
MSFSTHAALTRLEEIAGPAHVLTEPSELDARQVNGLRPAAVVRPADAAQIAEVIRFASAEQLSMIPSGSGTKLAIGSTPSRYDIALNVSRMNRILAYDPRDLTLGVEPGIKIENLLSALAGQNQFLPLAVPFADRATIGGIVAANSSSPLRHAYGAVRDFCLGMEFVTGEGTLAKSGGRVVKNVTGYDLHKLLIGSLGTLAVITRVNFRTFPLPPSQGTFVASFLDAESAFGFCRSIAHSVLTPQMVDIAGPGAAHMLISSDTPARIEPQHWSVIVSAAGQPEVVDRHGHELGHMAGTAGAEEFLPLEDSEAQSLWARVREFPKIILDAAPSSAIFRIGAVPTAMPSLLAELARQAERVRFDSITLTRASGIVYAAFVPEEADSASGTVTAQLAGNVFQTCARPEIRASAMLEWCPPSVAKSVETVWGLPRTDFALMARVKAAFDPRRVLSPGRFAGGI